MGGLDSSHLEAKKLSVYVPMSAQQLIDHGIPLPPGMEPPPPSPRPPWHRRTRWAYGAWKLRTRERIGFWIAGYTPDD